MEHESQARLVKLGVTVVTDVKKEEFSAIAKPMQDDIAKGLGPNAVKILALVRAAE
jgi:TRAP-type C4-dicarboxylate transport system substrate-binding protein